MNSREPSPAVHRSSPRTARSVGTTTPSQTKPNSLFEWQLFSLLQRANLLQYFDTFIAVGGDDVQQLLEAGEDEFLEIMALVGMHSKPLHVRRLQKALQEYGSNPGRFHMVALQRHAAPASDQIALLTQPNLLNPITTIPSTAIGFTTGDSPGPSLHSNGNGSSSIWPTSVPGGTANILPGGYINSLLTSPSGDHNDYLVHETGLHPAGAASPSLTDGQVKRIAECANELANTLPEYEPKMVQNKKKIGRDLLTVMEMTPDILGRLDEFRRYAAIYGRFDAKRKADKPLTLHEVSVNEAAAQICLHRPALLTRRDELFPLARQVVRDAGYNYVKGPTKSRGGLSDTEVDQADLSGHKRSTPASIDSSGEDRCHTPRSSTPGSPPACSSGGGMIDPMEEVKRARLSSLFFDDISSMDMNTKRQKLLETTNELGSVMTKQEELKKKVSTAREMSELTTLQRELQLLSHRQMELTNKQAALLESLGEYNRDEMNWKRTIPQIMIKKEPPVDHPDEETSQGQISFKD